MKIIIKAGAKPTLEVDIDAATEKWIPLAYTPGTNTDSVAEHTIAFTMTLATDWLKKDRQCTLYCESTYGSTEKDRVTYRQGLEI